MNHEYAPAAIEGLYRAIKARIPAAELSGILGDPSHTYGYHRARAKLPASDYSVQLRRDQLGDAWAASALDVKLPDGPDSTMTEVSWRLRHALRVKDPRVRAIREFGGTLDGRVTYSRDAADDSDSFGTWDDSHLWHVHLSIYRKFATDPVALAHVAAVMAGDPMTWGQRARAYFVRTGRRFPLRRRQRVAKRPLTLKAGRHQLNEYTVEPNKPGPLEAAGAEGSKAPGGVPAAIRSVMAQVRKFTVAVVGIAGVLLASDLLDGTAKDWVQLVVACVTALGVYRVPNRRP